MELPLDGGVWVSVCLLRAWPVLVVVAMMLAVHSTRSCHRQKSVTDKQRTKMTND